MFTGRTYSPARGNADEILGSLTEICAAYSLTSTEGNPLVSTAATVSPTGVQTWRHHRRVL